MVDGESKKEAKGMEGKLEQMEDSRLVKVHTKEIAGKRPRGRPRKKWIDSF